MQIRDNYLVGMAKRKIPIVDDEVAASGLEDQLSKLGYEVDRNRVFR